MGQAEALSRLQAGTSKWRHLPIDGRFMEFRAVDGKAIADKRQVNAAQLQATGEDEVCNVFCLLLFG